MDSNRLSVTGNSDVVYLITTNVQRMTNNRLEGGIHGLNLFSSVIDRFEGNDIIDGDNLGIWVYGSTVWDFIDNEIRLYRDGVRVSSTSGVDVMTDNRITDHEGAGIHLGPKGIVRTVSRNTVSGNERGILVESTDDGLVSHIDTLASNRIIDNERAGIWCGQNTYIQRAEYNRLSSNSESIVFEPVNDSITPSAFGQSVFSDNVLGTPEEQGVRIHDDYSFEGELELRDNWWGADSGPSGGVEDPVTGQFATGGGSEITIPEAVVRFDPYLEAIPEEVPEETEEPSVDDYRNEDGIVDTSGLLAAVMDWRGDDIESTLLLMVIAAWRRNR